MKRKKVTALVIVVSLCAVLTIILFRRGGNHDSDITSALENADRILASVTTKGALEKATATRITISPFAFVPSNECSYGTKALLSNLEFRFDSAWTIDEHGRGVIRLHRDRDSVTITINGGAESALQPLGTNLGKIVDDYDRSISRDRFGVLKAALLAESHTEDSGEPASMRFQREWLLRLKTLLMPAATTLSEISCNSIRALVYTTSAGDNSMGVADAYLSESDRFLTIRFKGDLGDDLARIASFLGCVKAQRASE